ncbi:MAG: hypothetical protein J6A88_01985, partial [Oscillospiraceae bacterium]|nr:hypothetical protein [Oscillospiraceae bacterium]
MKTTKRILSMILCLAMVAGFFTFGPISATAEGETQIFKKVTEAPTDWAGTYLIVYEAGNKAFDGSLSSLDVVNNYESVTITDDKTIAATDALLKCTFDIASVTGGYTIKSKSGYYIGNNSNSNALASSTSTQYVNTISLNADGSAQIVGKGNAVLRYNATSGQDRFRYYKSSSYTNQKAICLYKLETVTSEGGEDTPVCTEHTWGEGVQTVAPTVTTEGVMTYTCTVCNETKTAAIAKLDPSGRVFVKYEYTTLVSGTYILLTPTGYAPTVLDGSWVMSVQPFASGDNFTDDLGGAMTLTVDGDTVIFTDANGKMFAPVGTNNEMTEGEHAWKWSCESGKFIFKNNDGTRTLCSNKSSSNKFRPYATGTVTGNPASYPYQFTLYKLETEEMPDISACEHADETKLSIERDAHNHWTYCSVCASIVEGSVVAHDTNGEDGVCSVCGFIPYIQPVEGTNFHLGIYQENLDKFYFLNGVQDGFYLTSVENMAEAADFYLEATDGGYYVYFVNAGVKTYLNLVTSTSDDGTKTYLNPALDPTPTTVYTYDETYGTLKAAAGYIATSGTYTTVGGKLEATEGLIFIHAYTAKPACVEHTWNDGVVTTPATSTTEGVMTYTCTVCGLERTETIEMLSPTGEPFVKYESATLVSGTYILVAGNGYSPSVLNGTWIDAVKAPTLDGKVYNDAGGVWILTVTENGVTLKDANGVFVQPKSQTDNGIKEGEYVWTVVYDEENGTYTFSDDTNAVYLASNNNSDSKFRAYKKTTLDDDTAGIYSYSFTLYKLEGEHVHTPGEAVKENEKAPTCTEDGSYDLVVKCTDPECGEVISSETVPVSATGHSYGDWVVTKDATCTETGSKEQTCSACGDVKTEVIPTVAHTPGKAVVENIKNGVVGGAAPEYDSVVYCTKCKTKLSSEHVT